MKIIFKITRTELQNLFYSPVAWFLIILFFIQCAYFYMAAFYPMVEAQDWMMHNIPSFKGFGDTTYLTGDVFFGGDGIIANVGNNLYLFIPLLTMGVISREINNGTIKLLYSSPIKLRQIILGKYLAVMTFCLMLIAIVAFFMIMGAFQIKDVDYGRLLSTLLGLLLLVGTYSAIGLFMSSLSNYQIVSGIATFMVFFILSRIGGLWQKYDFVRDLTWFLSINGRIQQMVAGLITTRDVIYFILIIFMFLSFTLFKLKGEKETKSWITKTSRYAGVLIVSLLLGYITSRPVLVGYLDATAEDINTIDPKMQQILKKMGNEPLEITLYANLFGGGLANGLPENRNGYIYGFWDKYIRFKPDIKFKYVYYYDDKDNGIAHTYFPDKTKLQAMGLFAQAQRVDSAMFIPPSEIRKHIDPFSEELRLFITAKYKGDTVNLRTYDDSDFWPNEVEMASKFKRLVEKKWPKIYFLTGNLQRNIYKTGEREYYAHTIDKGNRSSLVNSAFDVDTLSLEKQDIPADITALVLADPKIELGTTTQNKLVQYIARGGNMFILGEPGKQAILNPVLQELGVQQMKGQLVQTSTNETPDKILSYPLSSMTDISVRDEIDKLNSRKMPRDSTSGSGVSMSGAAALTYIKKGSFKISPLLKTLTDEVNEDSAKILHPDLALTPGQKPAIAHVQRKTWLKMGRLVIDSVPPVFSPQDGDIKRPSFITAVSLTRQVGNKHQQIIVLGDADGMSTARPIFGNVFYTWFDHGEHPVFIDRHRFQDNFFNITAPTAMILKITCVWVLPGLLLLAGIILLIRRKRK
jgi:ABC-2 type transport system permease protein